MFCNLSFKKFVGVRFLLTVFELGRIGPFSLEIINGLIFLLSCHLVVLSLRKMRFIKCLHILGDILISLFKLTLVSINLIVDCNSLLVED